LDYYEYTIGIIWYANKSKLSINKYSIDLRPVIKTFMNP
jgi:hypothetical protein